jgi:transketolase
MSDIDRTCINTIRTLAMEAVQAAESGHPGTPMALASVAYCLWQRFMRFDPADPIWPNRDRFILSNGHASMLLYAILHLIDVKSVSSDYEVGGSPAVSLDDIKQFRQLGSKCPGHPEYHLTSGVEATTGPQARSICCRDGQIVETFPLFHAPASGRIEDADAPTVAVSRESRSRLRGGSCRSNL